MLNLNLADIKSYYEKVKRMALSAFQTEDYIDAINKADLASIIAYNLNWIYKDDEIETLLKDISEKILIDKSEGYTPIKGRFVFYDQIGNSTVLALQYLRALMSANIEFMYVLDPGRHSNPELILSELEMYPRVTIIILEKDMDTRIGNIQKTYETIVKFKAERSFIHAPAEGAFGVVLWNALFFITRYRIVPGDHHFYLGTSITDYAIEFRNFGATLAIEKRNFDASRILIQPYYPIIPHTNFKGLPFEIAEENVVMISGGAFYKILGFNDIYYNILKRLLKKYPFLIICYAGSGDDSDFVDFINKNNLHNRLYLLGYRTDINEVIKYCDIYLGTYPFIGGLMSQYAAVNSKPILQYTSPDLPLNNVEDIICCNNKKMHIVCYDLDCFFDYADKLICDKGFREREGEKLYDSVVTKEIFQKDFFRFVNADIMAISSWKPVKIDYQKMIDLYLGVESRVHNIERIIAINFRLKTFILFPKAGIRFFFSKFFLKKIFRRQKL